MSLRDDALQIVSSVIPSDYGDPKFSLLIGDMYREGPSAGSTCGFLTSYLLYQLGCRDPRTVNRTEPEGLRYKIGGNLSVLIGGAKALGAWRAGPAGIQPGDIYYISNAGQDEHVGVYLGSPDAWHWNTADAGQTNSSGHQAARFVTRDFDGTMLGPNTLDEDPDPSRIMPPRTVHGYVDIEALPYASRPTVAGTKKWVLVGVCGLAVAYAVGWLD